MLKSILIFILLFLVIYQFGYSFTITGNNVIWSTEDKEEFIYSVYGKGTGKKIWKLYNIKEKSGITLFYGIGVIPQWSFDGKEIATASKNKIDVYYGPGTKKSYSLATEEIVELDFSYDGKKVVYSDGAKIYMLNLETGENSYVSYGKKPAFINKDKAIIFFDENYHLSTIDKEFKKKTIITNIVQKVFPFKTKNCFIFQDNEKERIKFFDLDINKEIVIVEEEQEIPEFSVSPDYGFVIYTLENGELYIANIPTRLKVKILKDYGIFTPRISKDNKYCSYEKVNKIYIKEITKYIKAFELDKIYKINIGAVQGITIGTSIEIYEERKNPFTGKVIGMDENKFKGVLKVITVYDTYCYAKIDEEYKTEYTIEINDIAYWKEKDLMGTIVK